MDKHIPKFRIGDKIFRIKDQKISEETIMGVLAIFDDHLVPHYGSPNKKISFEHFAYFFEIREAPYQYGWIKESEIFSSKEALIASL